MLGVAERHRINRPLLHDRALERSILAPQDRVGPQGVPEAPHGGNLGTGNRHHMHMNPVVDGPRAVGPPKHRPSGREHRRDLRLEAELPQHLGDGGDVSRVGGHQQVDDALAGQPGYR
jgi:hypothetical protein